jgi:hypothetical protein
VSVVLPASGWEMMAKVRRRETGSLGCGLVKAEARWKVAGSPRPLRAIGG